MSRQSFYLTLLAVGLIGLVGPIAGCASQFDGPQLSEAAVGDVDAVPGDVVIEDAGRSPGDSAQGAPL